MHEKLSPTEINQQVLHTGEKNENEGYEAVSHTATMTLQSRSI